MLVSFNDLRQFAIEATDGRRGRAEDFYFDDLSWQIRYLLAESGFLFSHREGLVKVSLVGQPDIPTHTLPVSMTKQQLDDADYPDAHPPVSEQRERDLRKRQFEAWPPIILGVPGAAFSPAIADRHLLAAAAAGDPDKDEASGEESDPHLRSMAEVIGYDISASDGDMGSISDILFNPEGWKIRYFVVDTGSWLVGRQVVIRPDWISAVSWADQSLLARASKDEILNAPELTDVDALERSDAHLALAPYGAYAGLGI